VIATKDNMTRRGWKGDVICKFCDKPETIHHLFFSYSVVKYMWSTIVSKIIGAANRPRNFSLYFVWIARLYPRKLIFMRWGLQFCVGNCGG
jgi:hypothetical protein